MKPVFRRLAGSLYRVSVPDRAKNALARRSPAYRKLEACLSDAVAAIDEVGAVNSSSDIEAYDAAGARMSAQAANDELDASLSRLRKKVEDARTSNAQLEADLSRLRMDFVSAEEERNCLTLKVSDDERKIDHYRARIEGLEEQNRDLVVALRDPGSIFEIDGAPLTSKRSEELELIDKRLAPLEALNHAVNQMEGKLLGSITTLNYKVYELIAQTRDSNQLNDSMRYLDLLESSLTGILHGDPANAPWGDNAYDPEIRAIGRDWPAHAETMIGTARMRNIRYLVENLLDKEIEGDFIETGVWRGGACIYMRGILAAHGRTDRTVWVADSFKGLPAPDDFFEADKDDPHHTFVELVVSREEVAANFERYDLLDDKVQFLEGWFKDTLPDAPIEKLALLRLDGDMYESTIQALDALYHKVSPGGAIIVDDYILPACAKAVDDFRDKYGITTPMEEVDGAAVYWFKPADEQIVVPGDVQDAVATQ